MRWSTTESSTLTLALRWPRRSSKERDGIIVDHETLRRWLVGQGLWQVKQRRRHYRQRRERRHRFGELVQFDGSHHEWFESRGESCCLMNMVNDATSTTLTVLFEAETTEAAMGSCCGSGSSATGSLKGCTVTARMRLCWTASPRLASSWQG